MIRRPPISTQSRSSAASDVYKRQPLTRGLVEVKLREARITGTQMHTVSTKDVLELGPFKVEFFHVCHSIPDAVGLAITTPVGLVVHVLSLIHISEPTRPY